MGYVWDFSLVASNHSTSKSLERLTLKRLEGALHVFVPRCRLLIILLKQFLIKKKKEKKNDDQIPLFTWATRFATFLQVMLDRWLCFR